jgi:homoserine kinase
MRIRVRVPGSTSNLGPGFDCLGLALDVYLEVELEAAGRELDFRVEGLEAAGVPAGSDNLVYASLCRVLRRAGKTPPAGLRVLLRNDIPLGRGLGSSGAAIVAGVLAGHLLLGEAEPDQGVVLREATDVEGHPDNIAPALLGGFVASAVDADRVHTCRLPFPCDVTALLVIPDTEVSTQQARARLPRTVPLTDAVFNLQRLALLLGNLAGSPTDLRPALQDRLHQEVRLGLVPGLAEALLALDGAPGCLGACISGSGPTLLGFFRGDAPAGAAAATIDAFRLHGVQARARPAHPDLDGATWSQTA